MFVQYIHNCYTVTKQTLFQNSCTFKQSEDVSLEFKDDQPGWWKSTILAQACLNSNCCSQAQWSIIS